MERLTHIDSGGWYVDDQSVAFDERRRGKEINRLAAYEDTGLTPEEIMERITPQPNAPLTLEELRKMDGEPVWICDPDGSDGMLALVDLKYELCRTAKGGVAIFDTYRKTWLAYRRKPEEATG